MICAGKKENPLESSFGVIMKLKVEKLPCHGGSWRAIAGVKVSIQRRVLAGNCLDETME